MEAAIRKHFSANRSVLCVFCSAFRSDFVNVVQREKLTINSWMLDSSRPLFVLSLLAPILPYPLGEGLEGSYLHSPSVPSSPNFCCPALWNLNLMQNQRMVIHVQQVPVPWKPPFSPQNIPFYPFWRPVTGQSRHHTTPGRAMTKPMFCLLLDWLKKTFE